MSYRTVKRLLGETGLEFKCRMLFATGLLILITGSFYSYSQLNLTVVRGQHRERGQLLIAQNLQSFHWKQSVDAGSAWDGMIADLSQELKPEELRDDKWKFIPLNYQDVSRYEGDDRPSIQAEVDAYKAIIDEGEPYVTRRDEVSGTFEFYQPVTGGERCSVCHQAGAVGERFLADDKGVFGVAKISFSLEKTDSQIGYNMGVLWATAIITAVLAMLAAAIIVRYVIVKPVQHLNAVSEAIAQGDLDQRADIRTGDEFEELSHAFNRMLRHLVTIQDELRLVNSSLDAKVDELAQANLSLHQLNRLKSEFLATMSHELRTPLNSILGFSDVLSTAANLTDRQKKYLLNIVTSGQHLLALINDILDLAKMEAGRMEIHPTDVCVPDFIEHVTASILPLAEKKNIDLQWEVDPGTPNLRQDLGKMQQILNNLLSNAVKFTPEGGRIRVSAQPSEGAMVNLVVADTGVGIPLEDQAAIFEKFRQGRNLGGQSDSLTREYEGTGLGLSIVKELAKLLGGEVFLESEFGKGSTFTVRLPLEIDAPLRNEDDGVSSPMFAFRAARVESTAAM
ncbi:MAG: HAMP domain-containing histidine kinase [Planctomycetaceae bacterium]|nr:HAMP domain-containing histidine kinase [Planctomycetaceae bacterium]